MRIVCIVLVLILGLAMADQTTEKTVGLEERMPPSDAVDQRHLETAAERRKREQRRGDGSDSVDLGNIDPTSISTATTNDDDKTGAKKFKSGNEIELQERVVDRVKNLIGNEVQHFVQKKLGELQCNVRRLALKGARNSRNLRVGENLGEDYEANDEDDQERRLQEQNEESGKDENQDQDENQDRDQARDQDRAERLRMMKQFTPVLDAIKKKVDVEVEKAMKDQGC